MSRLDLEFAEPTEEPADKAESWADVETAVWLRPEMMWLTAAAIATVALVLIVSGY